MRDLRMLCLHGYHGSGAILRRQMAPLTAAIHSNVELVYVDAPSLSAGDFGWWHEGFRGWEHTRDWAVELLRTGPQHAELFRHKLTVPSVHVTGRADAIVPRRDSILLADRFADPLIIEHPGGHVIPSGTAGRQARSWPRA